MINHDNMRNVSHQKIGEFWLFIIVVLLRERMIVMRKNRFPVLAFAIIIFGLSLNAQAATNPDLDVLSRARVVKFTGTERISQPFVFDLDVTVPHPALNFAKVVGKPLRVTVAKGRTVAGIVGKIEQSGVTGRQGQYQVRLVPALNRLTYRIISRTFAEMNAVQIVNAVVNDASISGLESRISNTPTTQEISVQYQESEFAYISRLLENEGIHYHFEPSGSGVKTVLGDSNNAFPVLSPSKLVFGPRKTPSITSFSRGLALHSGKIQAGGFNWKTPQVNLTVTATSPLFQNLVEGVFPAPVNTPQASQTFAAKRLAARVTEGQSCGGKSTYPQLQAGFRFQLVGHPRKDFNQEYVITGVEHHGTPKDYHNTFTCLPVNIVYRPAPLTPQPKIPGVMPGIVVAPQEEMKHVDEFGRVRVRFPWRNPSFSDSSQFGDSGWVRVAQIATGIGNTALWLPEVGDEVAIAFQHGDPRRPVIIGSLFNGKNAPPVQLPNNKTQTLFRSTSIPGGNIPLELFIEAKAGQEQLTLRTGSQFIRITPQGITASSKINSPSPTIRRPRPSSGLKTPTRPLAPKR
jgi:type VI secretion system secreted protein VgrG